MDDPFILDHSSPEPAYLVFPFGCPIGHWNLIYMKLTLWFQNLLPNLPLQQSSPISVNLTPSFQFLKPKKLGVFLDFFHFSHPVFHLSANPVDSTFSIHIYPEANHFLPPLSLPPWSKSLSPLLQFLPLSVCFLHNRQNDPVKRNQTATHHVTF